MTIHSRYLNVMVQAKLKAEEVKQAALEAEKKAVMEAKTKAAMEAEKRAAAEKNAVENSKTVTSGVTQETASSLLNTETKESSMGFLFSLLDHIFPMSVFSLYPFLLIQYAKILCLILLLPLSWKSFVSLYIY